MRIFIDTDFKCHASDDGTMREFDVPFFDGKCVPFIEGYRYIPDGEAWTREDGTEFSGEMVAPFRDTNLLAEFQALYEEQQRAQADMAAALNAIYGGNTDE